MWWCLEHQQPGEDDPGKDQGIAKVKSYFLCNHWVHQPWNGWLLSFFFVDLDLVSFSRSPKSQALCQLRYSLHHQQQKQALLLSLHLWTQDGSLMCSGCCVVSHDAIAALSRPNLKSTESRGSALAMVTAGFEVLLEITITGYLLHFNYPQPITLRCLANCRKRQKLWDIRGLRKQLSWQK